MDTILSTVQKVTVFLLGATIFTNLFSGTEYKKYFQYAIGVIVMVLFLTPLLSLFGKEETFLHSLKSAMFQVELEEKKEEMEMLGKNYEKSILKKWREEVQDAVAKKCGTTAEHCEISMDAGGVKRIYVVTKELPDTITGCKRELALLYGVSEDNIFIQEE